MRDVPLVGAQVTGECSCPRVLQCARFLGSLPRLFPGLEGGEPFFRGNQPMADEIDTLRGEIAELRRALAGALVRIESVELKARLAELQRGPLYMPYQYVGPDGRGWAAGYCRAEDWPAFAASPGARALLPAPSSMEEAGNVAAAFEMTFNRMAGIEEARVC
jgi:hypothetical protein